MNVEELLRNRNIEFTPKGQDYIVRCLSPDHDDAHPSMRVDQITGIFNCFSCGFRGNLFYYFGETVNELSLKREMLKRKIQDTYIENTGLTIPPGALDYTGDWRGISSETYKKFNAFTHSDPEFVGRIIFPITDVTGRIKALIGRHTTGGDPKYYIYPRKAKIPLFPVPQPVNGTVIIVEGIFDMLNLYDKGLENVVCLFGVNRFTPESAKLLKMHSVDKAIIMLDGDEAGERGTTKIEENCEKAGLPTSAIRLKKADPGELSREQVKKLAERLYS